MCCSDAKTLICYARRDYSPYVFVDSRRRRGPIGLEECNNRMSLIPYRGERRSRPASRDFAVLFCLLMVDEFVGCRLVALQGLANVQMYNLEEIVTSMQRTCYTLNNSLQRTYPDDATCFAYRLIIGDCRCFTCCKDQLCCCQVSTLESIVGTWKEGWDRDCATNKSGEHPSSPATASSVG